MTLIREESAIPSSDLAYQVARLLRHELGDLFQLTYTTSSILQHRLPSDLQAESRLLGDLKGRAELASQELDAVVDLLSPHPQTEEAVALQEMLTPLIDQVRKRFPATQVDFDCSAKVHIRTDTRAMNSTLKLLLFAFCQAAKHGVQIRLASEQGQAIILLRRDGVPLGGEQEWLRRPFATTQRALMGLAVATTNHLAIQAGGSVTLSSEPNGDILYRMVIPEATT